MPRLTIRPRRGHCHALVLPLFGRAASGPPDETDISRPGPAHQGGGKFPKQPARCYGPPGRINRRRTGISAFLLGGGVHGQVAGWREVRVAWATMLLS